MPKTHLLIIGTTFLLVSSSAPIQAQLEKPPVRSIRHVAMHTDFEIILFGKDAKTDPEALLDAGRTAFEAVDALENRISNWKADSYTSLVNKKAVEGPVKVSTDLIEILENARTVHRDTGGAFDVTVGPLIQFWKTQEKQGTFPKPEEVKPVLERIGLNYVIVDKRAETVFFERSGLSLDFGGIAKGLALDRMAVVLAENGVKTALLNAGTSSLVALGAPPGEVGWTVTIDSPYNTESAEPIATLQICDESLSTSSNARRYLDIGGKHYSHIFDPKTGMPASGIASATAIAPTGVESDALSTAFFVMGVEGVRAYCAAHPKVRAILFEDRCDKTEAIFINFSDVQKRSNDEQRP